MQRRKSKQNSDEQSSGKHYLSDEFPVRVLIVAGVLIVSALVLAIYRITAHMEPAGLEEFIELVVTHLRGGFAPEVNERNGYFAYIILAPLVPFFLALLFLQKKRVIKWMRYVEAAETFLSKYNWVLIIAVLAVFLFGYTSNWPIQFFSPALFSGINLLLCLLIFAFVCVLVERDKCEKLVYLALWVACISAIGFSIWLMLWNEGNPYESSGHYLAYAASVHAVVHGGRTLLLDYFPQYGLYAYVLALVFAFVPLHIGTFSIVMAVLMLIAFICNYFTLRILIQNRLLRMLAFFNIVYYTIIFRAIAVNLFDSYFQFHPHRYLFPSILLFLFVKFTTLLNYDDNLSMKSRVWYCALLFFAACSIMWNFDTGLVGYAAISVGLGFYALYQSMYDRTQDKRLRFSVHWKFFFGFLLGVPIFFISVLQIITFFRSGIFLSLEHLHNAFFFQRVFYNSTLDP